MIDALPGTPSMHCHLFTSQLLESTPLSKLILKSFLPNASPLPSFFRQQLPPTWDKVSVSIHYSLGGNNSSTTKKPNLSQGMFSSNQLLNNSAAILKCVSLTEYLSLIMFFDLRFELKDPLEPHPVFLFLNCCWIIQAQESLAQAFGGEMLPDH